MNALHYLGLTVAMTALFWLPYVLERMSRIGVMGAMQNPSDTAPKPAAWSQRAQAAHRNAVENLVLFAPAVAIAAFMDQHTAPVVVMASLVYLIARAAHFVIYTAGIPVVRTLTFAAGWVATLVILYAALV